MSLWSFFGLDEVSGVLLWACIANIAGFYMQRLHDERPWQKAPVMNGRAMLAFMAKMIWFVTFFLIGYVAYKVGWVAGLSLMLATFLSVVIFNVLELLIIRANVVTMAYLATPIGIVATTMLLLEALWF
jgi:hypothetical protein